MFYLKIFNFILKNFFKKYIHPTIKHKNWYRGGRLAWSRAPDKSFRNEAPEDMENPIGVSWVQIPPSAYF